MKKFKISASQWLLLFIQKFNIVEEISQQRKISRQLIHLDQMINPKEIKFINYLDLVCQYDLKVLSQTSNLCLRSKLQVLRLKHSSQERKRIHNQ